MLSRDALKRIGVLGVTMGLVASPLAWSAGNDKEADATGEQGGTSTMTEGASGSAGSSGSAGAGSAGTNTDQGTEWEEENGDGMESENTGGGSGEVSNDPTEAGAPGVEGGQGTQGGEEPEPSGNDNPQGTGEGET